MGRAGRATTVSVGAPCGLTWSGQRLLVGTRGGMGGEIRAVNVRTGWLTDLAGAGVAAYSSDGHSSVGGQVRPGL